ncbi:MAG: PilZ domain-containing protein [Candidatus Omnitrophica bacterium]|nr:PilZ domain-containing protein [Candidatus Omnitrophota bacterium]
MEQTEKRVASRVKTSQAVLSLQPLDPLVWFRFWTELECLVRDISMAGVCIYSKEDIPIGTALSIDLRIGNLKKLIRIFCKVAWVKKENQNYRMGLKFSWWKDDQDKNIVSNFLNKLSSF